MNRSSSVPPHRELKPGEFMQTRDAIRDYYRKRFLPEGKQPKKGFVFAKRQRVKP